jgi:hypothetical protein
MEPVTEVVNFREDSPLLPVSTAGESESWLGRTWSWLKQAPYTTHVVKGVVGVASTAALGTLLYKTATIFANATSYSGPDTFYYELGIGVATPLALYSIVPASVGTPAADWISNWSWEIIHSTTQFYLNAGCPRDGMGFWNTTNPPLIVSQVSGFSFSAMGTAIPLLSLRFLIADSDETDETDQTVKTEKREEFIPLFLESGARENRRLIIEQAAKIALGTSCLGLYFSKIVTANEWLYAGYYALGHVAGAVLSRGYLELKDRTIDHIKNAHVRTLIQKAGTIAEFTALAGFFAWEDDSCYLLVGAMAGAAKIAILDTFENLTENDEQVSDFEIKRIDIIAKGAFLALFDAWYIAGATDPTLHKSDIANITSFLTCSHASYPLTRYLAKNFKPGENSRFFNSMRFYFVNYQEALILPYMLVRASGTVGNVAPASESMRWAKQFTAWTSLGLAAGNNRALQGIRSHRKPNAVSDVALLVCWYLLYSEGKFA